MPTKAFTDIWVQNVKLKSAQKQEVFFDTKERLVLVVGINAKTFRLLTYVNGKAKTKKLGRYPDLSLRDARQKARDFAEDPKKFEEQSLPHSFREVATLWIKQYVDVNGLRSKPEIERILKKYIFPKWADRKFLDIRRGEINALLDYVSDKHGRSQADAVLKIISSICKLYAVRTDHYVNPIVKGMKRSKKRANEDQRYLDDEEIKLVWAACDQLGTFGRLMKFALLTAQRRGKLGTNKAAIKWADIQGDVWTIAVEDGEKGTAQKIKLPPLALDVLKEQPRIVGNDYVFPNVGGTGPYNSFSDGMDELRALLPDDMPTFSMHDLRRTARKMMTRAGVRPDYAELALGHSIKGIQGIYDDRTEYHGKTDYAFECVANEIEKVLNPQPANVVSLRK